MAKYVAVTGCAGFIGRALVQKLLERGDFVYGIDRLDYAADPEAVERHRSEFAGRYSFVCRDLRELGRLPDVEAVIHLAASTHVDNSLTEGEEFVANNVGGTAKMLELVRAKGQHGHPFYIHISTDEVYGSIADGVASEDAPLNPTSPYAASKAAADMLVGAWGKTYGIPYAIVRPTNAYGENQHPEKLIPKAVRSLMLGRPIPIHGDGSQTRCWLNVEDLAAAILLVLDKRLEGIYNVGGNTEASVQSVVLEIGQNWEDAPGEPRHWRPEDYSFGHVRPACDMRYAVDDSKIRAAGWAPTGDFWRDLPPLVAAERLRFRF